jgi:myo-inositol-1(or 4)-monophosphatase
MNIELITDAARELVIETGLYIKTERENFNINDIEVKGKHDYVTFVDKNSEKKLFHGLSAILPEAGFITEENASKNAGAKYIWIIDPLDGTTNFIHGLPPFAISLALMENKRIILGIVYEVNLGECFYANIESKSYLNGKEINVSKTDSIDESLIATGFPYYDYQRLSPFMNTLEYFFKNSRGVRRLGSAATDLAYVACGRFDCFYEYNLNSWDVAAGSLIVQQAGGKVSDFNGDDNYVFGKEIIASNNILSGKYVEVIKKIMLPE